MMWIKMSEVVVERNIPNWPEKYEFKFPTLSQAEMAKNNQAALLLPQATQMIVSDYLRYCIEMDRLHAAGEASWMLTVDELAQLINRVQNALKTW